MFAYGFGLDHPKFDETLVYNGEPLQIEYYIDNNGMAMSAGLLMFVNGIPQPYSVDGGNTTTYMYIQPVEENERVSVQVAFVPVWGKADETVSVRFLSILNPQIRPDQLDYIFGHTNRMTTFHSRTITMKEDAPEQDIDLAQLEDQRDMTQEEIDQVIYIDRKGNSVNKMEWFHFVARNVQDASLPYLNVDNQHLMFTLQGYGGPAAEYFVVPFINHIPVFSGGYPCIMTVESGTKLYSKTMTLDLSDIDKEKYMIQGFNTFYILAIPLDCSKKLEPVITSSLVFSGEY